MDDSSQLYDQLTQLLAQWHRRRFLIDALLWLPRGLLAGLVASAAVAALARFRPVLHNREVALMALIMALLGLSISVLALFARKTTPLEQARFFDRLFDLRERVSTAVEIQTGQLSVTPTLREHQLEDAARAASLVDARAGMALKPHWPDVLMVFIAIGLLVLATVMPNAQSELLAEQQAVAQSIDEEVARLQALEQRTQEEPALDEASREMLLEPIRRALGQLEAGELSREEVVAALSEAEAQLRELAETGSTQAAAQALQAAGQSLSEEPMTSSLGDALAGGDLAQAAMATQRLAETLAQLSADEVERLAQLLAERATLLSDVDPVLAAELANAAQALRDGELAQAQGALNEAAAIVQQHAQAQEVAAQALAAADELQSARAEVAMAGSQAGEPSSAGSSQGGQDSPGQASAGAGSGAALQGGPGAGSETQEGQGAGGPGPGGGHASTVFVPNYVDLGAEEGVEVQLPTECLANPENCGQLIDERPTEFTDEQSLVPYEQVFGNYRDIAFEALEGEYVPLGMKGLVRDYFSSLEP